jgi:hypothetical protein
MKRNMTTVLLTAAAVLLTCAACGKKATVLTVTQVLESAGTLKNSVAVIGVMAGVSQSDPTLIGLVDTVSDCNDPNCKEKPILAVRFKGQLPAEGDEVVVIGSMVTEGEHYLLAATSLKVLRGSGTAGKG